MPREVIRLAIRCVAIAQEHGHTSVSHDDIDHATRRFSKDRLADLASDFQYQYPGLKVVFAKLAGGRPEFDLEYLREIAFRVADRIDRTTEITLGWAESGIDDPLQFARALLRCGFLLLKTGRDANPREATPEEIEQIDETTWYAIHPMYLKGLELHGTRH